MKQLRLLSPAKLNLFLHITGRRTDGYHTLQTLFQLLDYGDTLTFTLRNDGQVNLTSPLANVPAEDNLALRAAKLLQLHGQTNDGVDIELEKILPLGGGIGGGSSNAATTLLALNQLWHLGLNPTELAQLGLQLGADVPVFVHGQTAWAEGVGEELQAIEIPEKWYFVIKPRCEVSTGQIFSHKQLTRTTTAIKMAAFFEEDTRNDCEPIVRNLYPEVDKAFNWLNQFFPSHLTGTGACVFAECPDRESAQQILDKLPSDLEAFIAKGVNQSPTLLQLKGCD